MEKILLVINAHKPNVKAISFACGIARDAGSRLTGVFVENVYFEYIPSSLQAIYDEHTVNGFGNALKEPDLVLDTDLSIRIFKEQCEKGNVIYEIYEDKGEPIQEIIFESRFSDLLIIDPAINFQDREEDVPSHFTKEILLHAECPVLLTPDEFDEVEEIVCCYDGTASSVYAIKQFIYLFPFYSHRKITILEVDHKNAEEFNESRRKLMYLLRCHFCSVLTKDLKGNAEEELFKYFFKQTGKIIVMGAYGRGSLSNLFRTSTAEMLIRMVDLPLFITHL